MLDLTINFGTVALRSDMIFGCLVHAEGGVWVPFSEGSAEEKVWVREQVNGHPHRKCLTDGMRAAVFGD